MNSERVSFGKLVQTIKMFGLNMFGRVKWAESCDKVKQKSNLQSVNECREVVEQLKKLPEICDT